MSNLKADLKQRISAMGLGFKMPDVDGMMRTMDERFGQLVGKLDEMLVVLRDIRGELQTAREIRTGPGPGSGKAGK